MFKFFSQFFSPRKKNKNILCGIDIQINLDGTVNILCSWPNFNSNNSTELEKVSTEFSTLLYFLNKGFLSKEIINTLTHLSNPNNKYDKLFVDLTLEKWTDYIESDFDTPHDMQPIVRPSSVFNNKH